ncbi:MAG: HU family DNA-binding protein [Sideroxydans sp.]|nr:HU family DNA-binding protein [Sideroxydans sp.]
MNKLELIEALATKSNLTRFNACRAIDILVNEVVTAVTMGKMVTIAGFGTFKPAARAARVGKNPKTGAPIKIQATTVPKFTPGVAFRDMVAKEGKIAS